MTKGSQSDTFDSFTRMPNLFFKSIGIIPYSLRNRPNDLKYKLLLLVFFCSHADITLVLVGECIYFFRTFGTFTNFVDAVAVFLCIGFIFLSFAKVGVVFSQRDKMGGVMRDLERMFPKNEHDAKDYNVAKFRSQSHFLMKLYAIIQMVMIWCFSLYPLLETLSGYIRNGSWEVDFPYPVWYPYNPYGKGYFELNYFIQIWGAYVSACGMLATDLLLCGAVEQISMHFNYLNKKLLNMKPNEMNGEAEYNKLKKYIQYHNQIMRYSSTNGIE